MNKDRFMKDFNSEKIFSLEYDKETLRDMVLEKQEEIKDLKKQIELLVKDDESSQQTIINQKQEIERLKNIIKETKEEIEYFELQAKHLDDNIYLDEKLTNKLLEILDKGSDEISK